MKITNLHTQETPFIIHAPGPKGLEKEYLRQNPLWPYAKNALFESLPTPKKMPQGLEIITLRSGEQKSILEKSLDRLDLPYRIRGMNIENKNWRNRLKPGLILTELQKTTATHLLILDSLDVMVLDMPPDIIEQFEAYNCEAIYNAEKKFWPDLPSIQTTKRWFEQNSNTPYKFLNAGCAIGKRNFFLEYYAAIKEITPEEAAATNPNPEPPFNESSMINSEQIRHLIVWDRFKDRIKLDTKCQFFQPLTFHSEMEISFGALTPFFL